MDKDITSINIYKVSRIEDEFILKLVLEFLNVKDIFKLRDKYDGQSFYDKIKMKLGAKIACDNFFSVKKEIVASELRNYNPSIVINRKRYFINTFNINENPIIELNKNELNTIFVLYRYPNTFNIIGYCNGDRLNSIINLEESDNHTKPKYVLNDLSLLDDVNDLLDI